MPLSSFFPSTYIISVFVGSRPGPKGVIVPNEKGRTNVLDRYLNDEITLTLPDNKKITDIAWFAIYDLSLHDAFGDIYIPEDFEPPDVQVRAPWCKDRAVVFEARGPGFDPDGFFSRA